MCGIAGYQITSGKHAAVAFRVFTRLMEECQVRGLHGAGVSWVSAGKVRTHKASVPASELLQSAQWNTLRKLPPMEAIGHTRYSTSGLEPQPLSTPKFALAHNGLVSMGTKKQFEAAYGVKTTSDNDAEIILQRVAATKGSLPLAFAAIYRVSAPVFACAFLSERREVSLVRDHLRPLWLLDIPSLGFKGFASTEDIIERALLGLGLRYIATPLEPYTVHVLGKGTVDELQHVEAPELRFKRPPIKNRLMLNARRVVAKPKNVDHRTRPRWSFKQYCVAAVSSWEIDPNYPLMNYLFRRYELSKSQEYWACFLYGTFYHPGSVFYVMQEFPEFEKVDLGRLKKWHAANWRQLQYNTDRKYEKGHFVEMFESYRDVVGGQSPTAQEEFFAGLLGPDPVKNFRAVTAALHKLWHFGRYSVYIYTECLHRCMGMPMQADTIFLKEADSPRHGLCIVLGKEEWAKGPLSADQWQWLTDESEKLLREVQREYPLLGMDHWLMESCLCAYKGYFRPTKGRYIPYYLDRMGHEIAQMREVPITSGVDWRVLQQFRDEVIIPEYLGERAEPPRLKVTKSMEHVLRDTGRMIGLEPIAQRGLLK